MAESIDGDGGALESERARDNAGLFVVFGGERRRKRGDAVFVIKDGGAGAPGDVEVQSDIVELQAKIRHRVQRLEVEATDRDVGPFGGGEILVDGEVVVDDATPVGDDDPAVAFAMVGLEPNAAGDPEVESGNRRTRTICSR